MTSNISPQFFALSQRLPVGMITPILFDATETPNGFPFVVFVGRDTDSTILSVSNNPILEFRNIIVPISNPRKLLLMWILIKISGQSHHIYEIGVNLADPTIFTQIQILAQQNFYEIVLCGESKGTIIQASIPSFAQSLNQVIISAPKYCPLIWSSDEYIQELKLSHEKTAGPHELWDLYSKGTQDIKGLLEGGA